ncbi:MAG: CDP-2,3-bis-(O-geranylgeranyl)-sn-glycerol synthase [Methanothrix sp.]|jgi:CDP-2,3-bis-(O-geranylgeranyl)-sn-glycerol synthase|uniref:CDP-2,3-bis-(O-geranylgeranyl)-sn-glycerol synthase n=1 Tax=Methanothrix sp. TaxID=90426 RepID=UPI00247DFD31|nr:CDP-2,3-bis-(O-geranylgeranyl)-sn-glycerol synthase [Methanothrix sp.]
MNIIVHSIWLMLPAYVPNNFAALFGGGTPLDLGMSLPDGHRVFGNGKTIRGTIAGVAGGIIAGVLQNSIAGVLGLPGFGDGMEMFLVLFGLSAGSMLGDLAASFIKRRLGMERGASFFLVDQLDFVMGAWALTFLLAPEWFNAQFTSPVIILVLLITPVLHRLANVIGYMVGAKKEPW